MKNLFSILLIASFGFLIINAAPEGSKTLKPAITPESHRLIFDLDEVVLKYPDGAFRSFFWQNSWSLLKSVTLSHEIWKLKKRGATGQDYIAMFQEQNAPEIAAALQELTYSKIPMPGMPELLTHLHALGYQLDIASNMSSTDFAHYEKKYPEIFNLFTNIKVVQYCPDIKSIKKPNPIYFEEFLKEFPSDKKSVFFDDKKENVQIAEQCGFIGYVFTDAENFPLTLPAVHTANHS